MTGSNATQKHTLTINPKQKQFELNNQYLINKNTPCIKHTGQDHCDKLLIHKVFFNM